MATYIKKPNGKTTARIRIIDENNKQIDTSKTFANKKLAERWARKLETSTKAEISALLESKEESAPAIPNDRTVAQAVNDFIQDIQTNRNSYTLTDNKRKGKFWIAEFGNRLLSDISKQDIREIKERRLNEGKANDTVRLELSFLKLLFEHAIHNWDLDIENPALKVKSPPRHPGHERVVTEREMRMLIQQLSKHENPLVSLMCQLTYLTGLRSREIGQLEISDINFIKKLIKVRNPKSVEQAVKARYVPMYGEVESVIQKAIKSRQALKYEVDINCPLLFPGQVGYKTGKHSSLCFSRAFKKAVKELNLPRLRFHDFRHTATTNFFERHDLSIVEVSAITGHKSLASLKRYTHLDAALIGKKLRDTS